MFRRIAVVSLLITSLWCTSAAMAVANDANYYITTGRADMFRQPLSLSGIRQAYADFDAGLNDPNCLDCNSSKELVLLHAVAKTAMLFIDDNDVAKDSFLEIAKQFGITITGDALNALDVNVPLSASGCYTLPAGAQQAAIDILPRLISDANDIIAELDSISDPNFSVFFDPNETGLANNLEAGYGEVLVLKSLVTAMRSELEAKQAYNTDVLVNGQPTGKIKTMLDAAFCNSSLPSSFTFSINNDLLGRYPNLLKILPTAGHPDDGAAILAQSRNDLIAAIGNYSDAINFITSEPNSQNHLIYIDPNDANDVNSVNATMAALKASLQNDTAGSYNLRGKAMRIDANPVFGATARYPHPVVPRDLLPQFSSLNEPIAGTFGHGLGNDATLGGILPDMTQQDWISQMGLSAPDLTGRVGIVALPDPLVPGDKGKVQVIVTNVGDGAASGKIGIEVYASSDQTLDGNDVLIGVLTNQSLSLSSGLSKTFTANVAIPGSLSEGAYYLIAKVDSTNAIAESNEQNNTAVTGGTGTVAWKFGNFDARTNVRLAVNSGNVVLALTGGGYGEVTGGANFDQITLYNTTTNSQLQIITTGKNTNASVGDIVVNGSLKGITAKTTNLRGGITVTGSLGTVTLGSVADGHTIAIGASADPKAGVAMTFDRVSGLAINSQMPVKSISATEWLGGSLTAPSIAGITTKGDKKRSLSGDLDIDVTAGGVINTVKVAGRLSGSWDCNIVKSITAADVNGADLALSKQPDVKAPALGSLTVKNRIVSSRILSAGNIGTISAGGIANSSCFAGVSPAYLVDVNAADGVLDLPSVLGDTFNEPATIKSIAIKGIKGETYCFINSNIAAANISSAYVTYPQYNNGGTPFGISMYNNPTGALTIKDATGTHSWKGSNIGTAIDWLFVNGGNMQIRRD